MYILLCVPYLLLSTQLLRNLWINDGTIMGAEIEQVVWDSEHSHVTYELCVIHLGFVLVIVICRFIFDFVVLFSLPNQLVKRPHV